MTDAGAARPRFRVLGVFGRSFTVLFRNIVPFGVLALILTLPYALWDYFTGAAYGVGDTSSATTWYDLIGTIIGWVFGYLLTAALTFGTIRDLRGNRATVAECLQYGMPLIGKVIGLAILLTVLVGLGMVALVIPGLIVATVYWVAIPVAVIEQTTIGDSFRRAAELSKGNRWRIFGLLVLFFGCYFLLASIVLGFLAASVFTAGATSGPGLLLSLMTWVVFALVGAFSSVLYAISYHDLRIEKEGADIRQIAAVFD